MGKIFKIPKKSNFKIRKPEKVNESERIFFDLAKLLNIDIDDIYLGGSYLLNKNESSSDIDILVKKLKNISHVSKKIKELVSRINYQLPYKKSFHRRRFIFRGKVICPFGIDKNESFFEKSKFVKIRSLEKIQAKVMDSSLSLLSPSRYKIKVNNKDLFLISYFVGHNNLLREGEVISLKANLFEFTKGNKKVFAYVIPIEGTWIEIINRR